MLVAVRELEQGVEPAHALVELGARIAALAHSCGDGVEPELVRILTSPVMLRPHESLQGHEGRKILVATSGFGNLLEIYDVSNCRAPVLRST